MKVTGFGEVLWDCLPDGKVLGGAPLNVMVRLRALGADVSMISRCGIDADGDELLRQVQAKNIPIDLIQRDEYLPTGLVNITLNQAGSAAYEIVYPCAWDKIALNEAAAARVKASDALVYGSLATRDARARDTLQQLVQAAPLRIFDVNLRPPHYEIARLAEMMHTADVIKLNDDELYELGAALGSPDRGLVQNIEFLSNLTDTAHICVTLGGRGAVYWRDGEMFRHQGYQVNVADTVGAGDNFLAGFVFQFLRNQSGDEILRFACALGALAAAQHGAMPDLTHEQIEDLINNGE